MADSRNTGSLVYTNEQRGFRYTDSDYVFTGSKVSVDGAMTAVDNGSIQKNGQYNGYFNVRMENAEPKVNVGDVPLSEYATIMPMISDLVTALATVQE